MHESEHDQGLEAASASDVFTPEAGRPSPDCLPGRSPASL